VKWKDQLRKLVVGGDNIKAYLMEIGFWNYELDSSGSENHVVGCCEKSNGISESISRGLAEWLLASQELCFIDSVSMQIDKKPSKIIAVGFRSPICSISNLRQVYSRYSTSSRDWLISDIFAWFFPALVKSHAQAGGLVVDTHKCYISIKSNNTEACFLEAPPLPFRSIFTLPVRILP
jgi:hypothetical protein